MYKAILLVNHNNDSESITLLPEGIEKILKVAIEVFSILFNCVLFPDKHCVFTSLGLFLTLPFCLVKCCVAFQVGLANSKNSSPWGGVARVLAAVLVWSLGQIYPHRNWDCWKLEGCVSFKLPGLVWVLVVKISVWRKFPGKSDKMWVNWVIGLQGKSLKLGGDGEFLSMYKFCLS